MTDHDTLAGAAITGARIFDGYGWHDDKTLLIDANSHIAGIVDQSDRPDGTPVLRVDGGILAPGFVDLQVNGGGGVLLNESPTAEGIATICKTHCQFGTTALLATLVTDTKTIMGRVLDAGRQTAREKIPGFLGLHLEGPHLSTARKGAHDPTLIRPMADEDRRRLIDAVTDMPVLLTTVAPEAVTCAQIQSLAEAGIVVSLGHSNASCELAQEATDAGATMVTHLFNAMSPLGHREPGMVGNALANGRLHAGIIADGIHVDARVIAIALRSKRGPGHLCLVTDAMATTGTALTSFMLNGRTVYRRDGRLTLADGTLAGADTDMIASVRFMHQVIGLPLDEALRMASLYPAQAVGRATIGHLRPGAHADIVHMSASLDIRQVWTHGRRVFMSTA